MRVRPSPGARGPWPIATCLWTQAALRALPPLVKAYLRLGAMFGDGAVVDRRFGTTDVLVVLPVVAIGQRYTDRFGPKASRRST